MFIECGNRLKLLVRRVKIHYVYMQVTETPEPRKVSPFKYLFNKLMN